MCKVFFPFLFPFLEKYCALHTASKQQEKRNAFRMCSTLCALVIRVTPTLCAAAPKHHHNPGNYTYAYFRVKLLTDAVPDGKQKDQPPTRRKLVQKFAMFSSSILAPPQNMFTATRTCEEFSCQHGTSADRQTDRENDRKR